MAAGVKPHRTGTVEGARTRREVPRIAHRGVDNVENSEGDETLKKPADRTKPSGTRVETEKTSRSGGETPCDVSRSAEPA